MPSLNLMTSPCKVHSLALQFSAAKQAHISLELGIQNSAILKPAFPNLVCQIDSKPRFVISEDGVTIGRCIATATTLEKLSDCQET